MGRSFGGYGLRSGLTHNGNFYYTYSWGSGIHRSQVGKLRVVDGELKFWESGGFSGVDLLLTQQPEGAITVLLGTFNGFNRWPDAAQYGRLDETDPAASRLIGPDGSVLTTLLPTEPPDDWR